VSLNDDAVLKAAPLDVIQLFSSHVCFPGTLPGIATTIREEHKQAHPPTSLSDIRQHLGAVGRGTHRFEVWDAVVNVQLADLCLEPFAMRRLRDANGREVLQSSTHSVNPTQLASWAVTLAW